MRRLYRRAKAGRCLLALRVGAPSFARREIAMSNIIKYDFEGHLYSFNLDGWFNATEAAKRYGKRPVDWLRQGETRSYIEAMAEVLTGMPEQILHTRDSRYVKNSKVGQDHF